MNVAVAETADVVCSGGRGERRGGCGISYNVCVRTHSPPNGVRLMVIGSLDLTCPLIVLRGAPPPPPSLRINDTPNSDGPF